MQTVARKLLRQHDRFYTYTEFRSQPACRSNTGLAVIGTNTAVNHMLLPEANFEYSITSALGETIKAPVLAAGGLDVALDQTDDNGVEITRGITARSPCAFTIGTHAFYGKLTFSIADVSGTDDCCFGFRKAAAYAAFDAYTDAAVLNVISGTITIETILNDGATTTTSTTDTWADAATHTLEVYVSAAGVVTYKIDGAAPTATATFTFDTGDVVIPFFSFLHASDLAGAILLQAWDVGLQ